MKVSSGAPSSGRPAAAALPDFSKAWLTSATERVSRRTEPSPTRVCQSRTSLFAGVDGLRDPRRCSRHLAALTAEATAPDQLGGGSNDAVADHQNGHRCAADDIDLRRRRSAARHAPQVGADQLVDGLQNALFGNAHQHDGLLVLDQLEAGQHSLRIDSDQELNRFSGIADRIGEIGIQVYEALQVDRRDTPV